MKLARIFSLAAIAALAAAPAQAQTAMSTDMDKDIVTSMSWEDPPITLFRNTLIP